MNTNYKKLLQHLNSNGVYIHIYLESVEVIEGMIGTMWKIQDFHSSYSYGMLNRLANKNQTRHNQLFLTDKFCSNLDNILTNYIMPCEFVYDHKKHADFELLRVFYNKSTMRNDMLFQNLNKLNKTEIYNLKHEMVELIKEYGGTLELFMLDSDLYTMFQGMNVSYRDTLVELFELLKNFEFEKGTRICENFFETSAINNYEGHEESDHLKRLATVMKRGEDYTMEI